MKIECLTSEEIIQIHDEIIEKTGGEKGIINKGQIEFISDKMKSTGDIFQKAVVLLIGVIREHPFVDGNKRTALQCIKVFLIANDKEFKVREPSISEEIIVKIARNELSNNQIREWIKSNIGEKDG